MSRSVGKGLVCAVMILAPAARGQADRQVVDKYCLGCHNERVKTSGISFAPATAKTPQEAPEVWERVVRKLRTRSMPPAGLPRPDEHGYTSLLSSLEAALDKGSAAKPNPGRTDTFRRLNRTEYQNAIRDLLALDVDVSSLLPADESSHGFDNVTVGELSPTLLERYLSAARKISRLAIGTAVRPGGDTLTLPPDLTQEEHFEDLPLGTRGGTTLRYTFPVDAKYDIQVRLMRDRNEHVEGLREAHEVEVMVDGARVGLFTVQPPPAGQDHSLVDNHLNTRIPVKAGPHVVAVAFPKKASLLAETERQPWHAHFNMDRHPRITPAVYSVTVNGPYEPKGPGDTPSRRRVLVCRAATSAEEDPCAKRILATTIQRAYRRPVTDGDLEVPFRFYRQAKSESGFDSGIELALSAVLVSPEFLFRVEQDPRDVPSGTAYRISDLELASRLSFFLWSSIPDDELLDAAVRGDLHKPETLEKQVRRMLADPRSRALVTSFAEQWLYLRNLASITPDMRLFPDFDDNLRRSFRKETELFFESILREDRSILDLLQSNYTFVNERLAKHYGIPNVYGSRFRRITFPADSPRGGLLGQGSVLTVTSYATRTSPVIRGKWILDNILGVPPPPPPATVPALKEKGEGGKNLPFRERIAQHRANPACYGCHQMMDPLGFSLENYDAVGRWRTLEDGRPIDASGSLPDGTKFDGVTGLQKALLSHRESFANRFTEKLLTYALGRGMEYYDGPAVRTIVRNAREKDFRFSAFILGITASTPFQMRRTH